MVWLLLKALYGLHQAGRQWFFKLDEELNKCGFKRVVGYNCLYTFGNSAVLLVYVDDIVLFAKDDIETKRCIDLISKCFDIVNLGPVTKLLGVNFDRDADGSIILHQKPYIDSLAKCYNIAQEKLVKLPGNVGSMVHCPKEGEELNTTFPYRSLIGSLMFIATRTRPDILFSIILLSQYNTAHTMMHVNMLLQVLQYVISTKHYSVNLSKATSERLYAYSDASWASDRDSRRSFGGFLIFLGGVPVSWGCKKQTVVAMSTMEAEFIAMVPCAKEIHWLSELYNSDNIFVSNEYCPVIYSDSLATVHFTKNQVENNRTKHIDIKYHFLRDWHSKGYFRIESVPGKLNIADIFTKWLSSVRLQMLCEGIFNRK
jgi:hypothetical protein